MNTRKATRPSTTLLAIAALALAAPATADAGQLNVEILNIESDKGQVGCSLWTKSDGFPSDSDKAMKVVWVKPKGRKATCVFKGIEAGTYSVSVMHDLDMDRELDSNLVGRPKEPWGVSNDVPMERFGPPKFQPTMFKFDGTTKTIKVKLRQ